MTGRQVAVLRGVNVGRAKRVAMAELREVFESLGYQDVRTLLNSGNLAFTSTRAVSPAAAARIERAITAQLLVITRVTLLEAEELGVIIAENSLFQKTRNPSHLLVAILADPADRPKLRSLLAQDWNDEAIAVGTHAAYLWCPGGIHTSALWKAAGRLLGDGITTRNWTTIMKLYTLATDGRP